MKRPALPPSSPDALVPASRGRAGAPRARPALGPESPRAGDAARAFLAGKYDLGWETPGIINRTDWVQIEDSARQRRPGFRTREFTSSIQVHLAMRADRPPFNDVRVRRAVALALDRQGLLDAVQEGAGALNPPVNAFLKDWSLPVAQLGEGARYYRHDPAEARRLLAAASHASGLPASVCFTTYGSTVLVDTMQLVLKRLPREVSEKVVRACNAGVAPDLVPRRYTFVRTYPGESTPPPNQRWTVGTQAVVRPPTVR